AASRSWTIAMETGGRVRTERRLAAILAADVAGSNSSGISAAIPDPGSSPKIPAVAVPAFSARYVRRSLEKARSITRSLPVDVFGTRQYPKYWFASSSEGCNCNPPDYPGDAPGRIFCRHVGFSSPHLHPLRAIRARVGSYRRDSLNTAEE